MRRKVLNYEHNQDDLFGTNKFDVAEAPTIIENYFSIVNEYSSMHEYTSLEQKFFYIMHINKLRPDLPMKFKIEFLEKTIKEFKPAGKITTDARKMIQVGFRELIDAKLASLQLAMS